ncbi:MAG: diphthamide synthesis protein [Candidatus Pacearchaeota archaeon]
MKILFVETRKKIRDSEIDFSVLDKIDGKKISVGATVQYLGLISKVKNYLEKKGKKVLVKKGVKYAGHVLGCNSTAFDVSADTFLLITDGKFHAINNAVQLDREIIVFNGKKLEKIERKEIDEYKKKIVAKKKIFFSSDVVGLLQSTKTGQKNDAVNLIKKKIEKLGKEVYIFESDVVNISEFENFPQIKIWVNTACFGLAMDDKRIINLVDILKYLK